MAAAVTTTTNAAILKQTYTSDFALAPTEEAVVADFINQPFGTERIGNKLYFRKIKAVNAGKWTAGVSGLPAGLAAVASTANTEEAPSTTLAYAFGMLELDEPALTRLVDDGNYRNGIRKQLAAAVNATVDTDAFALAATFSHTESGAAVNDTMYMSAIGQLSTYAKNKFKVGETEARLFVHPTQVKNALAIEAAREYRIRGSAGSAVSGALMSPYGLVVRESGNVYNNGANHFNVIITKDAWGIGYNIKPSPLPEQQDGIVTRLIFRAEYGLLTQFDECGVALLT